MKRIIGIDIDGVLANFNKAYRAKLIEVTGRDLIPEAACRSNEPGEEPPVWFYAEFYGYTKDEDSKTWKAIIADPMFWRNLEHLRGAKEFLWNLDCEVELHDDNIAQRPEVYFITTRPGTDVKGQTVTWLSDRDVDFPTVLITRGNKGQLAQGLGLTHFLDDKPENCFDVKAACPSAEVFMLSCRYNLDAQERAKELGIHVIGELNEFEAALQGNLN